MDILMIVFIFLSVIVAIRPCISTYKIEGLCINFGLHILIVGMTLFASTGMMIIVEGYIYEHVLNFIL
ncbi:MAG: hypothetical protein ATN36_05890 [Epulopiscium sp. Nele67-Bin005]|nr:MAG: hypothetical protein ATN36_05890 [Epulopiscium sp. Nele67-Bin005]